MKSKAKSLFLVALALVVATPMAVWLGTRPGGDASSEVHPGAAQPGPQAPDGDDARAVAVEAEPADRTTVGPGAEGNKPTPAERDPSASQTNAPTLSARVTNPSGFPLPGAVVRFARRASKRGANKSLGSSDEVTTGADGRFALPRGKRKPGDYALELRARGHRIVRATATLTATAAPERLGDFVVPPAVVLAGVVLDATGRPVAGARVRRATTTIDSVVDDPLLALAIGSGANERIETDVDGAFELAHEPAGAYVLFVDHDDHPRGRFEGVCEPVGTEALGLMLQLPPSATIEGHVSGFPAGRKGVNVRASAIDPPADGPLVGALLAESGVGREPRSRVAADGSFALAGLEVGRSYRVRGIATTGLFESVRTTDERTVLAGTSGVVLNWDAGASVVFRAVDAASGAPLDTVHVTHRWTDEAASDRPQAGGSTLLTGAPQRLGELRPSPAPGSLALIVSADGYVDRLERDIVIARDATVDLGVLPLRRVPTVRVLVSDERSGTPIEGARVAFRSKVGTDEADEVLALFPSGGRASKAKTDATGACELSAGSSAATVLTVTKKDYADHEQWFAEGVAGPELRVALVRGGTLEVQVVDTTGQPVADAEVTVEERSADATSRKAPVQKSTNRKGRTELADLRPGEYRVRAQRPDDSPFGASLRPEHDDWRTAVVTAGATRSVELEIPALAELRGVVTLRDEPLEGARVTVQVGRSSSTEDELRAQLAAEFDSFLPGRIDDATTDSAGRYALDAVPTGQHRLRIEPAGGHVPAEIVPIDVALGENVVDVELSATRIAGRVVDSGGRPIERAHVRVVRQLEGSSGIDPDELAALSQLFGSPTERVGIPTDAEGRFTIDGVPPGVPIRIETSADGYAAGLVGLPPLELDGELSGVEIALEPGASIQVVVAGEVGAFASVRAHYAGAAEPRPQTAIGWLRAGRVVLADLHPGPWRIVLDRDADDPTAGQLAVAVAGEVVRVELEP